MTRNLIMLLLMQWLWFLLS